MSDTPPAGWYPAPHANNEQRYWDGQGWASDVATTPAAVGYSPAATVQTAVAPPSSPMNGSPAKGLAVTGLILGIVAFAIGLVPWLGVLMAIAAITVSALALVKKQSKALALTGLILGIIALITGAIATASLAALVSSVDTTSSGTDTTPTPAPTEVPEETTAPAPVEEEPVAEQPAEAPAPAADGSVAAPLPQPYVAEGLFGGDKYSLTGKVVSADANAQAEEWNQFNPDAPAGFKYVVVELTMTGIDPDGVEPSLANFDLYLATAEGNKYSNEFLVFGEGMPSMSDGPTLYPGSAFTGYTAYIVPIAAQSFLLYDNSNYISF